MSVLPTFKEQVQHLLERSPRANPFVFSPFYPIAEHYEEFRAWARKEVICMLPSYISRNLGSLVRFFLVCPLPRKFAMKGHDTVELQMLSTGFHMSKCIPTFSEWCERTSTDLIEHVWENQEELEQNLEAYHFECRCFLKLLVTSWNVDVTNSGEAKLWFDNQEKNFPRGIEIEFS